MGKYKRYVNKNRKGNNKMGTKRKRKEKKDAEIVNKKAIFNRYKDKQKIEEVIAKRNQIEMRFRMNQESTSESEYEDDTYEQLVSSFKQNTANNLIESEEESMSDVDKVHAADLRTSSHNISHDSTVCSENDNSFEIDNAEQVIYQ